jgi:hypothetical protein
MSFRSNPCQVTIEFGDTARVGLPEGRFQARLAVLVRRAITAHDVRVNFAIAQCGIESVARSAATQVGAYTIRSARAPFV